MLAAGSMKASSCANSALWYSVCILKFPSMHTDHIYIHSPRTLRCAGGALRAQTCTARYAHKLAGATRRRCRDHCFNIHWVTMTVARASRVRENAIIST